MKHSTPILAMTMGDPVGIGPEILLKALSHRAIHELCIPVILGDAGVLNLVRRENGVSATLNIISAPEEARKNALNLISLSSINMEDFKYGEPSSDLGLVSTFYVLKAAEFAVDKRVDALVTSAINKAMLIEAGFDLVSHSEMIQSITKSKHSAVMLTGDRLRLTRVTSHMPIRKVPEAITKERVYLAIKASHDALVNDFGVAHPKLAVCALNPHGGENGLFGDEETQSVLPAISAARDENIQVTDPIPADKVFPQARDGKYDAVICMYHDQAHIAYNLIDDGVGVNITLGLPIIRTAPDLSTQYSMAGKGFVSEMSMVRAIKMAARLAVGRKKSAS